MKRVYLLSVALLLFFSLNGCFAKREIEAGIIISKLINDNWSGDSVKNQYGESDSYFEDYEIYFDEGVSVKYSEICEINEYGWEGDNFSRNGNVENIIFNEKYIDDILSGINIKSDISDLKKIFGKPDFIDEELNVSGYKTDDFYVFFIGNESIEEVSVYPVHNDYDIETVKKAVELCSGGRYSFETADELRSLFASEWNNYNYSYSVDGNAKYSDRGRGAGIAYYSQGAEVFYSFFDNKENRAILNIYANCGEGIFDEKISITDSEGQRLIEYIDTDFVFEQEKKRLKTESELNQAIENEGALSPDKTKLLVDNRSNDGINVIDLTGKEANYCIYTSPFRHDAGKWLNDRYFLCVYGKGDIRVYDLIEGKYAKIASNSVVIKDVRDGEIMLDLSTVSAHVDRKIRYEFNENNEPVFYNEYGNKIDLVWNCVEIYSAYTKSLNNN